MITAELVFRGADNDEILIEMEELGTSDISEFLWEHYSTRVEHRPQGSTAVLLGNEVRSFFVSHSPDAWDDKFDFFHTRRDYLGTIIKIIEVLANEFNQEVEIIYYGIEEATLEFWMKGANDD